MGEGKTCCLIYDDPMQPPSQYSWNENTVCVSSLNAKIQVKRGREDGGARTVQGNAGPRLYKVSFNDTAKIN